MGLPIERLMIGTNANDILARALGSGSYEIRGVQPTTSPSMDIQISSNFERLLFEAYGRDGGAVRRLMAGLAQSRAFLIEAEPLARIRRGVFRARRSTRPSVAAEMAETYRATGYVLDPHTRRRHPRRPARSCGSDPKCPWWRSRPRIRPSSRTRSSARRACAPPCRRIWPT